MDSEFDGCAHPETKLVRLEAGIHWGKEMCADCGKFVRWVTAPRSHDLDAYKVPPRPTELPVMTGSDAQIAWAKKIRASLVQQLTAAGAPARFLDGMLTIADSTWWIANRARAFSDIRWPVDWLPDCDKAESVTPVQAATPPPPPPPPPPPLRRRRPPPPAQVSTAPTSPPRAARAARMEADLSPTPDANGLYRLTVSFEGRTSGTLRLQHEELVILHNLIDAVLFP